MTSPSDRRNLSPRERRNYSVARAKDIAFDAVQALWRRRKAGGMKQTDVVAAIGRHPAWVSRNLRAPGNWTLRTFAELVEALNGEIEIVVHAAEDAVESPPNYSAYEDYNFGAQRKLPLGNASANQTIGGTQPSGLADLPQTA